MSMELINILYSLLNGYVNPVNREMKIVNLYWRNFQKKKIIFNSKIEMIGP